VRAVQQFGFLGEGSRLDEVPSERLAATAFGFELESAPWLWRHLSIADLAHTRELVEAGVLDVETGSRLVGQLLEMHDVPLSAVELDPVVGDVYNNRDKILRDRFGPDIGRIHTGRARREATTLAWHLVLRELAVAWLGSQLELLDAVLQVSDRHRDTLMPDFTYLQHAHPTTLAHYLLCFAYPMSRDVARVRDVLAQVNRSPAGAGSVNGSRFPLDRERLARSMEFDGVVTHTRDAMWAPDLALGVMSAALMSLTTIDRMAEDLEIWATSEFGFVTLADRHCRTSVIMPQKKNPYALSMIRGHARAAVGDTAAVTATNLTPSGQPDNRATSYVRVPSTVTVASGCAALLAEVVGQARFDPDRMAEQAANGFAYSTDLCDFLVLDTGIDNRSAHRIVGRAVREAVAAGRSDLEADDLTAAARSLEIPLPQLDASAVSAERDLRRLIDLRTGTGGAGNIAPMLDELRAVVADGQATSRTDLLDFETRFLEAMRRFSKDHT
jgi:argininosuccinate lyase